MLLKDIAYVNIGVVLKRKEILYQDDNSYCYDIFNLKSYEENIMFEKFYSNENLEEFVTQKGDLLFRLAYPIKVIRVEEKLEGTIVSNQYCIIRMKKNMNSIYTIDFIQWFLESENAKHQFEKILIGTTVRSIPVMKLRTLEIPLIPKEKQEKLSKIIKEWSEQRKLYQKMIEEKDLYYNAIINKAIKKESKKNEK